MAHILDHPQSKKLEVIHAIIDATPPTCLDILQYLNRGEAASQRAGAKGMSAELVMRCLDVKTLFCFTNQELVVHIVDSRCRGWFRRVGVVV